MFNTDAGESFTFQIGETADSFNQLQVTLKSMSTSNIGTAGESFGNLQWGDTGAESTGNLSLIDISTAGTLVAAGDAYDETVNGAAGAIDMLKAAINYVSTERAALGAIQNRLDHTINNLGVMEENIQDAESTIRDTDVAEEMMDYTKNNILIQSAQAMLAQANAIPQGVLQLLQ